MPNHNGMRTAIKDLPLISLLLNALKKLRLQIQRCDLCGHSAELYSRLCEDCYNDIIKFNLADLNYDLLNWPNFHQAIKPVVFDHLIAIAPYQWPYSRWIIQLKYQGNFELAQFLSELMYTAWQAYQPKYYNIALSNKSSISTANIAVISVPMHLKKWQERGYNQAYLLAKQFCKKAQLNHISDVFLRSKATINQVGLTGSERRKNLKNAFTLQQGIKLPEHIILVDDVLTTGTTANELSKLLKQQGVKKITVFTVCLSLPAQRKS